MAEKTIATTPDESPASREETRSNEKYLRPAVDILESAEGLTIHADLPGVAKSNLQITIEDGVLTIKGGGSEPAAGRRDLYREFGPMSYYRQFQLPEMIDQTKTKAECGNGVLTLRLFKAEAAKPKKIEIQTA